MIKIICKDNVGLTTDLEFHEIEFEIKGKFRSCADKIKLLSVQKINELFNPKYPYFFSNLKSTIKIIDIQIKYDLHDVNILRVNLHSKNNPVYKMCISGLTENPVYILGTKNNTIDSLIKILYSKYDSVYSSVFILENVQLNIKSKLEELNLIPNSINLILSTKSNLSNIHVK
jgi:hypothetical protein